MAGDDSANKTRRPAFGPQFSGPRPVGALLPALTRPALRSRAGASTQLVLDWPEIVGPALAASTLPRRLAAGTLTLACDGPVALELQHLAGQLAERINAHYGRVVVERFRFVQATLAAPGQAPARRRPRPPPIAIDEIAPGPLRDALGALGAAVADARRRT